MPALKGTQFKLPGQTAFYKGKVRDVYTIKDKYLVMVATDRISAFDVILPEGIPGKGQVLNQIAEKFLKGSTDIIPNWLLACPDPVVSIGKMCSPIKIEMVVRGYLAGHAARTYHEGKRVLCGVKLPEGMKENDKFIEPIITPSTKADHGHDMDVSRDEILKTGLATEAIFSQMEHFALALFKRGSEMALKNGLLLVDTKYEFGLDSEGKLCLMDEIHTPDSSRYFYAESWKAQQAGGEAPAQLSKEFVRQWLISKGFQGKEGQKVPEMTPEWVNEISQLYIGLYQKVTGEMFIPAKNGDILSRIEGNINNFLKVLV